MINFSTWKPYYYYLLTLIFCFLGFYSYSFYLFTAQEINMNITHVKSNRHFCNKIWQAFKFIQSHLGKDYKPVESYTINDEIDQWILSRLNHMVESCDTHFKTYDLQNVTRALHGFWLNDFCDVYLVSIFKIWLNWKKVNTYWWSTTHCINSNKDYCGFIYIHSYQFFLYWDKLAFS